MMKPDIIPDLAVSHARLDADGRLLAADRALLTLNDQAGGALGAALAVPQLATVARLARRLGILVSRAVTVADQDNDLDLWVRVQPEGDGLRMAVSGWRELRARAIPPRPAPTVIEEGALAWETDASVRLTFVSIDAARRLGVDALSLLGQPLTALFALDASGNGGMPIIEAVARRQPFDDQPARLRGGDVRLLLTASVKLDADGAFAGLSGVARVEETAAAPDTPAISSGFTDGLDRALRAPLARIIAHADTIHAEAEGPVAPDYVDYASDIANAGRHLLALVDDLVDLQAVEAEDLALLTEPVDLADVARRAAGLLSVRAANAGVAIARPLPELHVAASGDFRRALQIMVNLIGNAVRYSPEGGVVSVTVSMRGDMAEAIVADQGKGIAPADQARIFEKFERVDPTEPGGNGLGLYIARRLARAMGGDLTVDSVPGDGARFTLTLPV